MTQEEKMVEKFRESGKSQREWCREAGIKRSTLRYWLERSEELALKQRISVKGVSKMYENMSNIELYSRLHFLENHTRYQADELAKKQHKIDEQAEEIKELKTELNRITEFLKLAGKKIYGSSTEKICEDYGQLSFFEEEKTSDNIPEKCSKTKVTSHERRKHRTFDEKLKNAPKTVIIHELTEEEKICPKCGSQMTVIGYDSFIQVEYIPARIEVQEHRKGSLP